MAGQGPLWHTEDVTAWRQNVIIDNRPVLTALRAAQWVAHCAARRPALVSIEPGGPRMRLQAHLRRYGSTSLFMKRAEYEPALVFLADLARPDDVAIDIGANVGIYSLMLAKRVGQGGQVYAFEPGADALAGLRENLTLNAAAKVTVAPVALSDRTGSAPLFHIGGPATFSLGGSGVGESVQLMTLDAWSVSTGLMRLDIIKIDVEGHEPAVFRGGAATLIRFHPLVMFEVSYHALERNGYSHDASWIVLRDHGYRIYKLATSGLIALNAVEEGNLFAIFPNDKRFPEKC